MSSAPPTDRASGTQLIIGICVLALALASFGWWWRYHEAAAPRELWGVSHMLRIRDAKKVEVLKLAPQGDMAPKPGEAIPAESFLLGSDWYVVAQSIDGSRVLGVNDFRRVLLADFGYDWKADLTSCQPKWEQAIRWTGETGEQTTLLYAPNCQQMFLMESGAKASIAPSASFAESFFKRALEQPAKAAP